MPSSLDWLLWGLYAFYVVLFLLVVTFLVGGWWLVAGRALLEAWRAFAAGDWWLPFLRRADGSWGPLVASEKRSAMRAEERGSRRGLLVRWGFWAFVGGAMGLAVGGILAQLVALVIHET